MKRLLNVFTAFVFVFFTLFAVQAFAAGKDMQKETRAEDQSRESSQARVAPMTPMRASEITGDTIKNNQGEQLGTVEDLVVGKDGRIQYLIVAHGGWLNIGERLFAIPWEVARPGAEPNTFVVNIDKDRLAKAPNFDRNTWPNFADPNIYNLYYGYYAEKQNMGSESGK